MNLSSWVGLMSCGRVWPCLMMVLWCHRSGTHGGLNDMATFHSLVVKRQKALHFFVFPTRRHTYSLLKIWILEFSTPPWEPKQHSLSLFTGSRVTSIGSRVNFNRKQHKLSQAHPSPPCLLNVDQPCIQTLGRYPMTSLSLFYAPYIKFYHDNHQYDCIASYLSDPCH